MRHDAMESEIRSRLWPKRMWGFDSLMVQVQTHNDHGEVYCHWSFTHQQLPCEYRHQTLVHYKIGEKSPQDVEEETVDHLREAITSGHMHPAVEVLLRFVVGASVGAFVPRWLITGEAGRVIRGKVEPKLRFTNGRVRVLTRIMYPTDRSRFEDDPRHYKSNVWWLRPRDLDFDEPIVLNAPHD